MERADAERVFALVAEIGGDIRGRIVSERWWLVWIVMGVQILITNFITQFLLWSGEHRPLVYISLWGLHVLLIPPIIFFIHRRGGGQRTATETFIWWIWTTFILAAMSVGLFNQAVGLPLFFNAPILGLLAAFAFSMMAMVTHRYFLVYTVIFIAVMAAMSLFPHVQFLIYGVSWCVVLVELGIYFRLIIVPHQHENHLPRLIVADLRRSATAACCSASCVYSSLYPQWSELHLHCGRQYAWYATWHAA